ncbi:unnamed protein product [Blepharisma stoltei]|uniref:Uncharacterized protein n=1 Tax=Blepharisma stoltei TaxID=1481888 RepID=A0AAU9J8F1_9CILI|nr:unnamed protein product [Blepharisma stoltei]
MGCANTKHIIVPSSKNSTPKWSEKHQPPKITALNRTTDIEETMIVIPIWPNSLMQINIVTLTPTLISISHEIYGECGITPLKENQIMLAGGINCLNNEEVASVLIIDLKTIQVTICENMPYPKRRMRLIEKRDTNEVFCIGGNRQIFNFNSYEIAYNRSFLKYSIDLNKWEELEDIPIGVEYPGAYILGHLVFVTGGARVESGDLQTIDLIQIYDLSEKIWKSTDIKLPYPVYFHIAMPIDSLHALVFGGASEEEDISETLLISQFGYDSIAEMPCGISPLLPYYSVTFENSIYTANDSRQLLCFNRSKREWKQYEFKDENQ